MRVQAHQHVVRTVGGVADVLEYRVAVGLVHEVAHLRALAALDLHGAFEHRPERELVGTRIAHDFDARDFAPARRGAEQFVDALQLPELRVGQHVGPAKTQRI